MISDRTRSAVPHLASALADSSKGLRLIVFCGGEVTTHPLPRRGEIALGRGDDADVRVDHATVSRRHATLLFGEELRIVDHGSFNGTRLGGKKLEPHAPVPLHLATIVELGETMIVVQVEGTSPVTGSSGARGPRAGAVQAKEGPQATRSPAMKHLHRMLDHVAQSNISVIVRGETGAGKEVVGEEIHRRSARSGGPLVKLNCAALPEQLLEGELFGYERGAFTGAMHAKPGLVEASDGGTLFLDEIGELPLATQAKLLRVVETRESMRLGSLRPKAIDVRFVAATHRDLESMVEQGTFRQDLYYRLNGVSLVVPPLRERTEEIPALAEAFVARFCRESKRPTLPISAPALARLAAHPWPGNVRELRNVVERAVVFCRGVAIGPEHLGLGGERGSRPPSVAPPSTAPRVGGSSPPGATSLGLGPSGAEEAQAGVTAFGSNLPDEMQALERQRILTALANCGGNQTQAAELLGISRRTLLRRLDDYAVPRPRKG